MIKFAQHKTICSHALTQASPTNRLEVNALDETLFPHIWESPFKQTTEYQKIK